MANEHLATYLNDHLAGSVVAVELMENLEAAFAESPIAKFVNRLRLDVEADQRELQQFMSRLEISESRTRQVSAWLTEKLTELKLRLDDSAHGNLRLFESLEALSLGIEGKKSLWSALAAAAEISPQLRLLDYDRLQARAEEQRSRVEAKRIEIAKVALKGER
ncbi:MAG TPA: hypothetical protein VGW76_03480 [Pyrinomonadaceae bacterium]|nr:hypothetical protein [Pyrinomonadaceae bacterium]